MFKESVMSGQEKESKIKVMELADSSWAASHYTDYTNFKIPNFSCSYPSGQTCLVSF